MAELEFIIGGLNIVPEILKFEGFNSYAASHKFVVDALGNRVAIYVAPGGIHRNVIDIFNLDGKQVGGGSIYINGKDELVLDDYSTNYGSIPKIAAQRFAELVAPELKKLGLNVRGIAVNPDQFKLNPFWQEQKTGKA